MFAPECPKNFCINSKERGQRLSPILYLAQQRVQKTRSPYYFPRRTGALSTTRYPIRTSVLETSASSSCDQIFAQPTELKYPLPIKKGDACFYGARDNVIERSNDSVTGRQLFTLNYADTVLRKTAHFSRQSFRDNGEKQLRTQPGVNTET